MSQKAYDLLGLAQRAGKIQSGEFGAEAGLKRGKAKLLIIAADASERTKKDFLDLAKYKNAPYIIAGEKMRLGLSLGKSPRSTIVITDENFAAKIKELFVKSEE